MSCQTFLFYHLFVGGDQIFTYTVWKFQDYSVIQILRETKVGELNLEERNLCENFRIFMLLRFYVKSILADFRRSKTALLTIGGFEF